jgi:hypothetical protein
MSALLKQGMAFVIALLAGLELTANGQTVNADLIPTPPVQASNSSAAPIPENYISRYEIFAAPSYLTTPKLNLVQRGFNADFVINVKRWLSVGVDYSNLSGNSDVVPQELTPTLQQLLASSVPPGTLIAVPYRSAAQTFGAGPQFNFRRLRRASFFVRPAGGGLHETITLNPDNPLTSALVAQIVPSRKKSDLTLFYGVGGGVDLNMSKHVGVRFAADFVHYKLFSDLLATGQNGVRLSVAPIFRFGGSVK